MDYADPIERLVTALKRLPGIGAKSAQRLAFAILHQSRDESLELSAAWDAWARRSFVDEWPGPDHTDWGQDIKAGGR